MGLISFVTEHAILNLDIHPNGVSFAVAKKAHIGLGAYPLKEERHGNFSEKK